MTTTQDAPAASSQVRTYGGWRVRRGLGVGQLDGRQTLVVLLSVLAVIVSASFSLKLAALLLMPALLFSGIAVAHWDGVWVTDAAVARFRFWRAERRGQTTYRSGVVVDHPRAWQLPGVLAPLRCLDIEDGDGGTFGVVWDRRTGFLSSTIRVAATGTSLAETGSADGWVANWGAWLAALGDEPTVTWVAVTVDTAPDPGSTLRDKIEARIDPTAPQTAQDLLRELVATSPRPNAHVETRVTVTFDTSKAATKPDNLIDAAAEASRAMRGLENALGSCGVSVLRRASAAEIAGAVRSSFDPASRGAVNTALARIDAGADPEDLLTWADAGPVAAEEMWDCYAHDSGISVTWALRDAPRQRVTSNVLTRLVAPGRFPRRVTMTYQVFPAEEAAKVVESERNASRFRSQYRKQTKRDETAREADDYARAERAALEESQGAGVVLWSTYVTTTVTDSDHLASAVADVEQRASAAKLRMRRMFGSQAAGFAATLPVGIYPPFLSGRSHR